MVKYKAGILFFHSKTQLLPCPYSFTAKVTGSHTVNMKVTSAIAALAAAASATELTERQDGHNSKPCPNKPAVTSVGSQHFRTIEIACH
jgi:hypothetical protein